MESLRAKISALRSENNEGRYFIPRQALQEAMTEDAIRDAVRDSLEQCGKEFYHLNELVRTIVDGARRIFAVLLLIREARYASDFIRNDQFQDETEQLDYKIPFSRDGLEAFLPKLVAGEFYERQWEVSAPVFSKRALPRALPTRTVMPILSDSIIGEGGFGVVHEMTLDVSHQKFGDLREKTVVRKEFSSCLTNGVDFELELRNLSILNQLRHPNIIELLGAYTFRGTYNLIFPKARSGDLAEFLRNERPLEFRSAGSFAIALSGLASAIQQVHEISADDLKMIGCHHDLKPKNILVDNGKFILADFGLSRFKRSSESSDTLHKAGQGDYLAPECEDIDGDFEKHHVRRSSDIWAFGCIIAELVTFNIRGADGVAAFREKRGYNLGGFKYYHFHNGPSKPNTAVTEWLSRLEGQGTRMDHMLLDLVQAMLSTTPLERPKITKVAAQLRFIAADAAAQQIDELYRRFTNLAVQDDLIEATIEEHRFQSWKWTCGFNRSSGHRESVSEFNLALDPVLDLFSQMRDELERLISTWKSLPENLQHRVFSPLRHLNNRLRDLLPQSLRELLQNHLEHHLIKTQDLGTLERTQQTLDRLYDSPQSDKKIAMLAGLKRMTILAMEHSGSPRKNLQLDPEHITYGDLLGDSNVGRLLQPGGGTRQVLIEWMKYESTLVEEQVGREMCVRVDAIAELLNLAEKPENFHALHCLGYFHDPKACRFGLVFDYPRIAAAGTGSSNAVTLQSFIMSTDNWRQRPDLGHRFKLAHTLATSLVEFHKVGWLHKNISSSKVVFFPSTAPLPLDIAEEPFLTGFSHSRPNEPSSLTTGPSDGPDARDYQHPEYLRNQLQYCSQFDYYSLGLILLEIGLWKSLYNMTKKLRGSPEMMRDYLFRDVVPRLKPAMGGRYHAAVVICLEADSRNFGGIQLASEDRESRHMRFEELVIEQLAKCSA